jgi:hypothetical protein
MRVWPFRRSYERPDRLVGCRTGRDRRGPKGANHFVAETDWLGLVEMVDGYGDAPRDADGRNDDGCAAILKKGSGSQWHRFRFNGGTGIPCF